MFQAGNGGKQGLGARCVKADAGPGGRAEAAAARPLGPFWVRILDTARRGRARKRASGLSNRLLRSRPGTISEFSSGMSIPSSFS